MITLFSEFLFHIIESVYRIHVELRMKQKINMETKGHKIFPLKQDI